MEKEAIAADGTTFDNGAGIALVPEYDIGNSKWNPSATTSGGYLNSYINKTILVNVANNLKKVLNTHLVNRRVLLSNSIDTNGYSNNYTWTTAYCTLMSIGQMTGNFAQHNNKYDDGEANYKLPLFNFMEYKTGSYFWSRGIYGSNIAWFVTSGGGIYNFSVYNTNGVRPLIYIR